MSFIPVGLLFKSISLLLHENSFSGSSEFRNSCNLLPPKLETQSSSCDTTVCLGGQKEKEPREHSTQGTEIPFPGSHLDNLGEEELG